MAAQIMLYVPWGHGLHTLESLAPVVFEYVPCKMQQQGLHFVLVYKEIYVCMAILPDRIRSNRGCPTCLFDSGMSQLGNIGKLHWT
jgi:hypothetical protein